MMVQECWALLQQNSFLVDMDAQVPKILNQATQQAPHHAVTLEGTTFCQAALQDVILGMHAE